jgi:hypothetical protein
MNDGLAILGGWVILLVMLAVLAAVLNRVRNR